jgi:SAM-dependent methyltransferase
MAELDSSGVGTHTLEGHLNMRILKSTVHGLGQHYCAYIAEDEYKSQSFNRLNERAIEYRFVFSSIQYATPRSILDVGTGTSALPSLMRTCGPVVTAIDNIRDYWPDGMINRHFYVRDEDATRGISGVYDMVTCISVLEHIPNHSMAVRNMLNALNPGGYLVLTFPYNENRYVGNVYRLPEAGYGQDVPYICQVYSRSELNQWFSGRAEIISQEYWQVFTGPLWTFGETLRPAVQTAANGLHQLTCLLVKKSS